MTLQEPSSGPEALSEALVFLNFFADLPDPRQAGKVIYPLPEVLLLCLLAVLAGAESFVEIARFGEKKIELLRRFLAFKDGTPSHDQLGDTGRRRASGWKNLRPPILFSETPGSI